MGDWRPFVYGGLASITAEFGTFPIDTTKTRLQIQGQKIDATQSKLRYRGMLHALRSITREEGIRALYSGIRPAILRQATYGTIKIGVYYSLKKKLMKNPEDENLLINVGCGVFAGVVSSSIANPTDVLKIRMQAHNEKFSRQSMMKSFMDIYKQEGVPGLWRGVGLTAQRAGVIVGVELPAYDLTKRYLMDSGLLGDTVANHFLSSAISSLFGTIASNPLDVIKTRMMYQQKLKPAFAGVNGQAIYSGAMDCLMQTVKTEGLQALYKGFIPTWLRVGPWNIIFFITYEQMKKFY